MFPEAYIVVKFKVLLENLSLKFLIKKKKPVNLIQKNWKWSIMGEFINVLNYYLFV